MAARQFTFTLSLGKGKAGLLPTPGLEALLTGADGNVGGNWSDAGFIELGGGNYSWTDYVEDSFRGSVSFRAVGTTLILAVAPINPESGATVAQIHEKIGTVTGLGTVTVDHDYGGTDTLAVMTEAGVRVANVNVVSYRKADYVAGRRTADYIVARTTTDVDGRWRAPLLLDPGAYTLLLFKQGVIDAKTVDLTVD